MWNPPIRKEVIVNRNDKVLVKRNGAIAVMVCLLASLCAVCLLGAQPAWALKAGSVNDVQVGQTFKVNGSLYKVTEAKAGDLPEVKLVKYGSTNRKPVVNVVKYKGQKFEVDLIGKGAFNTVKGRKIVAVTIGGHVDRICSKAFYGCSKLKIINMRKSDVIDIDRESGKYSIDKVNIGSKAFAKAGKARVIVRCGKNCVTYRKLFKKALVKRGLRKDAVIVK